MDNVRKGLKPSPFAANYYKLPVGFIISFTHKMYTYEKVF